MASGQPLQLAALDGYEDFVFDQASMRRLMYAPVGPWVDWWDGVRGEVVQTRASSRYATVPGSVRLS